MPFRKILPRIPCRVNTNIDVVFFAGPGLHRTSFHVCHVLKTNTKCKSPNKDHLLLIRAFYLLSGRQGSLSHRGRERVGWLDPGDAVVGKEINPKVSMCQENIRRVRLDVSIFAVFGTCSRDMSRPWTCPHRPEFIASASWAFQAPVSACGTVPGNRRRPPRRLSAATRHRCLRS